MAVKRQHRFYLITLLKYFQYTVFITDNRLARKTDFICGDRHVTIIQY
jgi:hypothetical protein